MASVGPFMPEDHGLINQQSPNWNPVLLQKKPEQVAEVKIDLQNSRIPTAPTSRKTDLKVRLTPNAFKGQGSDPPICRIIGSRSEQSTGNSGISRQSEIIVNPEKSGKPLTLAKRPSPNDPPNPQVKIEAVTISSETESDDGVDIYMDDEDDRLMNDSEKLKANIKTEKEDEDKSKIGVNATVPAEEFTILSADEMDDKPSAKVDAFVRKARSEVIVVYDKDFDKTREKRNTESVEKRENSSTPSEYFAADSENGAKRRRHQS